MSFQNPNFEWYSSKSKAAGLSPRCPIASVEFCPRYYASLRSLGEAKVITQISNEDNIHLEKKWIPFQPISWGEAPGTVLGENDELISIRGFCPEVSYNTFGVFATRLYKYADELDRQVAHQKLARIDVDSEDPRWEWALVIPFHYTKCQEYSVFFTSSSGKSKRASKSRIGLKPKLRWQILARDNFTCQYCGRKPLDGAILQIDHKISVNDRGTDEPDNLITACQKCNQGKGAESIIQSKE